MAHSFHNNIDNIVLDWRKTFAHRRRVLKAADWTTETWRVTGIPAGWEWWGIAFGGSCTSGGRWRCCSSWWQSPSLDSCGCPAGPSVRAPRRSTSAWARRRNVRSRSPPPQGCNTTNTALWTMGLLLWCRISYHMFKTYDYVGVAWYGGFVGHEEYSNVLWIRHTVVYKVGHKLRDF